MVIFFDIAEIIRPMYFRRKAIGLFRNIISRAKVTSFPSKNGAPMAPFSPSIWPCIHLLSRRMREFTSNLKEKKTLNARGVLNF